MKAAVSSKPAYSGSLQVVAAGLPRCATSSLKEAFENQLEVGPCMHMNRCVMDPRLMGMVHDAIIEKDTHKRRAILFRLFDGYAASADFPGQWFLEDLVEMYPDAKYILNVRKDGAEGWVKSMAPTINQYMQRKYYLVCWWSRSDRVHYRTNVVWNESVKEKLGVDQICTVETYNRYNAWVKEMMAERKMELFEWEPSMGWAGLCAFLGKKAPTEAFPRKNDQKHMVKVKYFLMGRGVLLWLRAFAVPTVAYYAARYFQLVL